jgi:hypothetical protein
MSTSSACVSESTRASILLSFIRHSPLSGRSGILYANVVQPPSRHHITIPGVYGPSVGCAVDIFHYTLSPIESSGYGGF